MRMMSTKIASAELNRQKRQRPGCSGTQEGEHFFSTCFNFGVRAEWLELSVTVYGGRR